MKRLISIVRAPFIAVCLSLLICTLMLVLLKESPMLLFEAIHSTFFTSFGLGYTLFYATPLILTGLSAALSFHGGLFNIGAEGQLYMGAISIVVTSFFFNDLSPILAIPIGFLISMIFGGLWGGLAGYLKAKRGCHEVIVTILLNFIAISLVDYLILYPLKNAEIQNPETIEIGRSYVLPLLTEWTLKYFNSEFLKSTPVNFTFFVAIITTVITSLFLYKTPLGFEIRAMGENSSASHWAGISQFKIIFITMMFSGAIAGLVGVNEVMGYQHKVTEGFSPGYGFTGIAVSLLVRNRPLGIVFSAILFGGLHNMSRELEFMSERVTKELSTVLQAVIIAFVAGEFVIEKWVRKKVSRNA